MRRSARIATRQSGRRFTILRHRERARSAHSGQFVFVVNARVPNMLTPQRLQNYHGELRALFQDMLFVVGAQRLHNNQEYELRVNATLSDDQFHTSTPLANIDNVTPNTLLDHLTRLLNSVQNFDMRYFVVRINWVRQGVVRGGGVFCEEQCMDFKAFVQKKRSCYWIEPQRERYGCFFHCVVLSKYLGHSEQLKRRLKNPALIEEDVGALRERCRDIVDRNLWVERRHLPQLEAALGIELYVLQFPQLWFVYNGKPVHTPTQTTTPRLVLLCNAINEAELGHFVLVNPKKMQSLWRKRLFCFGCKKAFSDVHHSCTPKCSGCGLNTCEGAQYEVKTFRLQCMKGCGRQLFNEACKKNHNCNRLVKGFWRCYQCNAYYKPLSKYKREQGEEAHRCYQRQCFNCDAWYPIQDPHQCYHQPLHKKDLDPVNKNYVFYDYECMLGSQGHEVAGVVAMYASDDEPLVFEAHDAFIDWVFQTKHKGYTFIAHNGGRYDFHFIKKSMLRRGIKSTDVCNGNTVFYCCERSLKIRFIDSYRFIPVALRKFPKTFGLTDVAKTFFPYRFFTPEHRDYNGPLPDRSWFDCERMDDKERQTFERWYTSFGDTSVNLYEMCMKYCIDDVKVLKAGCMTFRDLFLSITDNEIDPFQFITIASVCMTIYRRFYLPEDTIAILNQRTVTASQCRFNRMHEDAGREPVPEGYLDEENMCVYVWRDCVDTGCLRCFSRFTQHPTQFCFMMDLHNAFMTQMETIQNRYPAYEIIGVRECVFTQDCTTDELDDEFTVDIRRAFYGGRTEPTKCKYVAQPHERISYDDYTSLYPTVQFGRCRSLSNPEQYHTLEYPIGHPRYIYDATPETVLTYFGIADVFVTPPADLYLPVLPARVNKKLVFDCTPRRGCWTTLELQKAVEKGYVINKVYWVAHFEQRSSTLFRDYVRTFLKIKQEAAGWTKMNCCTPESQQRFIDAFQEEMGISLDASRITTEGNPGLYFISKLCLNSLWGKFAQRESFDEQIDTFDDKTFQQCIFDDTRVVKDIVMHDVDIRTITYSKKDRFRTGSKHVNIAIAAFTTAHARLRLYEALERTDRDTLYMDTDSIIYVDRGQLTRGPYLGDLTSELDPDETIVEFYSTGPKCYAYRTNKGNTCCKVKGFSLNAATQTVLNPTTLKTLVDEPERTVMVNQPRFEIDEYHNISSDQDGEKRFGFTFDKRQVQQPSMNNHCIDTLPWAYKK